MAELHDLLHNQVEVRIDRVLVPALALLVYQRFNQHFGRVNWSLLPDLGGCRSRVLQRVVDFDNAGLVCEFVYLSALLWDLLTPLQQNALVVGSFSFATVAARQLRL